MPNLCLKDPRGNLSTRTYNAKGWLLSVANALGHTTRYDYDTVGNALKATDPKGAIVSYTYDALNQLTQITDALGGTTRYTYDAEGRTTTVTDPGHDSPAGPVHIVTQYTYDTDGRIATNVDGNGNVLSGIYGSAADGN